MHPPTLPNRLRPFSFHFYRQFRWGGLGLAVFPILSRGAFASIAYATKRLTDSVLALHNPAAEASKLVGPFALFVGLVVARFVADAGAWFCSYQTRSPIVADGSHRELLRKGGLYAELWRKQSGVLRPDARHIVMLDPPPDPGALEEQATTALEHSSEEGAPAADQNV